MHALILTGGHSRRMGKDKALLKVKGRTILENTVRLIEPYVEEIFVSIREDQANEPIRSAYQNLIDQPNYNGPMAGILSAAFKDSASSWLIVSCDLPLLDNKTIEILIEKRSKANDATVFSTQENKIEPLCGIYESRLLKKFKNSPEIIEKMSPQLTLMKMDLEIIKPLNNNALYNLNRMSPNVSNLIDIE